MWTCGRGGQRRLGSHTGEGGVRRWGWMVCRGVRVKELFFFPEEELDWEWKVREVG